jgi:hypothetical protein
MPRAPYFVPDEQGEAVINLNGEYFPSKEWLFSCRKALASLIKTSQKEIDEYNKGWEEEMAKIQPKR